MPRRTCRAAATAEKALTETEASVSLLKRLYEARSRLNGLFLLVKNGSLHKSIPMIDFG
ncbi:MAG TPA: hypothetical protein VF026_24525 [Ktedonobacteraceae bacterium]